MAKAPIYKLLLRNLNAIGCYRAACNIFIKVPNISTTLPVWHIICVIRVLFSAQCYYPF